MARTTRSSTRSSSCDAAAPEGSALRFRVELDAPARQRLDLLASTSPGTAAEGADYLGLGAHPVTVPEGASGGGP